MDLTSRIIAFEMGDLNQDEVIELFQELIDTGMAWTLQGTYGRMASQLIKAGYCSEKRSNLSKPKAQNDMNAC